MAYDTARRRTVLFARGETWEWDGESWLQRQPATSPTRRSAHAVAFDVARQRLVLFGGSVPDTWEWDGTTWAQRTPLTGPPQRFWAAMAEDVAGRGLVLFGGWGGYDILADSDTWTWSGSAWLRHELTTKPRARGGHAMASDTARQVVVLFGGQSDEGTLSDTWEWTGLAWVQRAPAASPPARYDHGLAYDTPRQRTVLFGGRGSDQTRLGDTWEWDGVGWTRRTPISAPPARDGAALAYDPARQRLLLFGGRSDARPLADTWEWDGTTWTQLAPPVSPSARAHASLIHDPTRGRLVLFGGVTETGLQVDCWEWDGQTWSQHAPATTPRRRNMPAMAFDSARQRAVLFGGLDVNGTASFADTWLAGSLIAAGASAIGSGCAGTLGVPILTSSVPHLDASSLRLDLLSARPYAPCVLALASSPQSLALGGGCTLYLKDPIVMLIAASNVAGFASTGFPLPGDPTLRGLTFHAQGFVVDSQGPTLGLAASAGRKLTLGD